MTDSGTNDQELVDRLEEVWASIDSMCANLNDAQWKTPTDLPGWSVQDNVVHISGIESSILGRPAPDHTPPDYDHLHAVVSHPLTLLVLFGMNVPILVHCAHRFRYTLYDGVQFKHKIAIAAVCYGGAAAGVFAALDVLGSLL